jgi:hypothetical protein
MKNKRQVMRAESNHERGIKLSGRTNATCMPSVFIGCAFGRPAGPPIRHKSNWVKGQMKIPSITRTSIANVRDCQVAAAAERNQMQLETSWPANPPRKTVRTSRCASAIVTVTVIAMLAQFVLTFTELRGVRKGAVRIFGFEQLPGCGTNALHVG